LIAAVGISWLTLYTSPLEKALLCILIWAGVTIGLFILPGRPTGLREIKGKG
jgi:hypothetical protein